MDIIVTTPKSQMRVAAKEAADCIASGGGEYFRRIAHLPARGLGRIYYVEDGYIRGFAICSRVEHRPACPVGRSGYEICQTTGRRWPPGYYIYMDAKSWQWIVPIPTYLFGRQVKGFQGFRYADKCLDYRDVKIVGGWLDPKPATDLPDRQAGTQ